MVGLEIIPSLTSVRGCTGADVPAAYLEQWLTGYEQFEGLELDPDFQRGHVWTPEQQTRYIEHRLRGGISGGTLYWNCSGIKKGKHPLQIVDGKQRLTAIRKFLADEVAVFGGYKFSDFDEDAQRAMFGVIGTLSLRMEVNNLQTRAEVLQWYLELNEGAVAHTSEELSRVRALLEAE